MLRYIRAFFLALHMTVQGKRIIRPYDTLHLWMEQAEQLSGRAIQTVQTAGISDGVLKIEGREMTTLTILKAVAYHNKEEYPYLLHNLTEHSLTAIYASNMNDQFHVMRLRDSAVVADASEAVQQAIAALSDHLNNIPPSNSLEPEAVVK